MERTKESTLTQHSPGTPSSDEVHEFTLWQRITNCCYQSKPEFNNPDVQQSLLTSVMGFNKLVKSFYKTLNSVFSFGDNKQLNRTINLLKN
jgi:hypothetical protein